jgi:hypothetical protein
MVLPFHRLVLDPPGIIAIGGLLAVEFPNTVTQKKNTVNIVCFLPFTMLNFAGN